MQQLTIEVGQYLYRCRCYRSDNYDGDLTSSIVTVNVDTSTVGHYTVTYNVSDASGNAAVQLLERLML